jgi:hypothetical protein
MTVNLDELDLAGRASRAALQDLATLPQGTTTFLESGAIVGVHPRGGDSGGAPESWLSAHIDGCRSQALSRAIEVSPADAISRRSASRNRSGRHPASPRRVIEATSRFLPGATASDSME